MKKDSRIDQYINEANEFAKEIIIHLRKIISEAIPDGEETIKWNSPHFTYNGENICAIMAFKSHLTFTFWRGKELADREKILQKSILLWHLPEERQRVIKLLRELGRADLLKLLDEAQQAGGGQQKYVRKCPRKKRTAR